MPPSLPLVRATVFGMTNTLASIVLCLAIYVTCLRANYSYYTVPTIITATLHLVSVTAMAIIGYTREGVFTSKVSFEVGWLSSLCFTWLSTGARAVAAIVGPVHCRTISCTATQTIAAFGLLNGVIFLGYVTTLVAVAIKAGQAGRNIWLSDVKEIQWIQGPANHEKASPDPTNAAHPPCQQS